MLFRKLLQSAGIAACLYATSSLNGVDTEILMGDLVLPIEEFKQKVWTCDS